MILAIAVVLLMLISVAVAHDRTRVDLYDASSQREGYVIIDRERSTIETFDKNSKRTGYGVVQPGDRVDRYRLDGTREGSAFRKRRLP